MSSYNHIEKIKYTKRPDDPVALMEYILFEDARAEEKHVVFKFMNQMNQRLRNVQFEVLQYDGEHNLLEKSVAVYDNFVCEENAPFVPNAKLKLNFACKSLCVNLVFAAFDRVKWKKGEFTDNTYSFGEYAQTASLPAPRTTRNTAASAAPSAKKRRTGVEDVYRGHIALFPRVFSVLICLAVIAFVIVSLILFRGSSRKFHIGGFDLEQSSEGYVNICGYDGTDRAVIIPAMLGENKISRINAGAFTGAHVESVLFDTENVIVEAQAFSNCESLKTVSVSETCGSITVRTGGFSSCANLQTFWLPGAVLAEGSLDGCLSVKDLAYGGSYSFPLVRLFGEDTETISLNSVCVSSQASLSESFLDGALVNQLIRR